MPRVVVAMLFALLLVPQRAAAAGFTVQVASISQRSHAERLVATLVGRDLPAYWSETQVDGKTMYRVRVGSFPTREEATRFAEGIAHDLELQYWVAPEEVAASIPATAAATAAPAGTPTPPTVATATPRAVPTAVAAIPARTPDPGLPSAAALLARATAAHGGADGGFAVVDRAGSVVMRYRLKSLDPKSGQPVFSRHTYVRKGKDRLRLEISPIEAFATPKAPQAPASTTVASAEDGWVVRDGRSGSLASGTARARIEALGPGGMLRLPLAFPQRGPAAAGITGKVVVEGRRTLNGRPAIRLDAAAPPSPYKAASLYVSPDDDRLLAARFVTDAGELLLTFGDYRKVAEGLVVPFERTVYRDGSVVSSVEIDEFQLGTSLDDALFRR